jgi:hypothetical protein
LATIEGKITDSRNQPVEDAFLSIVHGDAAVPDIGVITNEKGEYAFDNISNGNYTIMATKQGYRNSLEKVSLQTESTYTLNFVLQLEQDNIITIKTDRVRYTSSDSATLIMQNTSKQVISSIRAVLLLTNRTLDFTFILKEYRNMELVPSQHFIHSFKISSYPNISKGSYVVYLQLYLPQNKRYVFSTVDFVIE